MVSQQKQFHIHDIQEERVFGKINDIPTECEVIITKYRLL